MNDKPTCPHCGQTFLPWIVKELGDPVAQGVYEIRCPNCVRRFKVQRTVTFRCFYD